MREAAKRNKVAFAVVATDASQNSLDKIVPLLNARRVRFIEVPSAAELGRGGRAGSDGGRRHRRSAVGCRRSRVGDVRPVDGTLRRMFEQAFSQ